MAKKIDGVIEAVRYKNGQIQFVRAYERRGFTFSDRVMLDRKTLIERLQKGKIFTTGTRQDLMASTFKTNKSVMVVNDNGHDFIVTNSNAKHDELESVPFF